MIHRAGHLETPSGSPENGRRLARIGEWFVEYSGPEPDQTDLDAYLSPPRSVPDPLKDTPASVNSVAALRDELNALKAHLRGE